MKTTLLPLLVLLVGCACTNAPAPSPSPPTPAPAPAADAAPPPPPAPGDWADQLCAHLAQVGCSQPSTCAATLRSKQLGRGGVGPYVDFKPACLAAAGSKSAAAACGTVDCP